MINFTSIIANITAVRPKRQMEYISSFARQNPNAFVKLAVEEIGAVELAEYLHDTGDLFELVDGLEAEALSNAKDSDDYYQQQETNYRG